MDCFSPEWVMVVATFIYVYYTTKLFKETKKLREVETNPFVTVYIQPFKNSNLLELVVENIGKSPAYNLKVNFDENIQNKWNEQNINLPELNINYLSVNQKLNYFIGKYSQNLEALPIDIAYNSKDKRPFNEKINYNFASSQLDISTPYEIEQLNKNFDKLVDVIEKVGNTDK